MVHTDVPEHAVLLPFNYLTAWQWEESLFPSRVILGICTSRLCIGRWHNSPLQPWMWFLSKQGDMRFSCFLIGIASSNIYIHIYIYMFLVNLASHIQTNPSASPFVPSHMSDSLSSNHLLQQFCILNFLASCPDVGLGPWFAERLPALHGWIPNIALHVWNVCQHWFKDGFGYITT